MKDELRAGATAGLSSSASISFQGFALKRTCIYGSRRVRGGASEAVCYQAEPGNKGK